MDYDKLYPSRFMKAGLFEGKTHTLTISAVEVEELEGDKGKSTKGIVTFKETPKQLVLNRTNGECLKAMFGRETNEWIGKRVTFYAKQIHDSFTDELIPAVRIMGSPDISGDKSFTAKIGRKQVSMKMQKVVAKGVAAKKPTAPAVAPATVEAREAEPISDEDKAEIERSEAGDDSRIMNKIASQYDEEVIP